MVYDPDTVNQFMPPHSTMQVPLVQTESRKVALESADGSYTASGEIVSSQTISSKTRTVETITVKFKFNFKLIPIKLLLQIFNIFRFELKLMGQIF
jgi:hypothetical protein